jgi:hypothetical protein
MPTQSGRACATDTQKASTVWPDSVRPLLSVMVTDTMRGSSTSFSSKTSFAATMAALALRVSKMVSMRIASHPPSTSPRICSAYASRTWSNDTARNAGSLTFGERESVLLVGPTAPVTNRGLSGVRLVHSSAAVRASSAAVRFSS